MFRFEIFQIFQIFAILKAFVKVAQWENHKKCYEGNFSFQSDVVYIFFGNYGVVFKACRTQIKNEKRYLNLKAKWYEFSSQYHQQTINENAAILANMGSPPLYPHPFHPSGSGLIHASVRKESISLAIICFAKKTISSQHQAFRLKNWFKICLQRTRPKIVCQFYTLCRVIILRIKIFQRLWGKNKEN